MRNSGVVPELRRKGIYSAVTSSVLDHVREIGYERVVSHHVPNNRGVLIAKLKLGFNIEGIELDDRWGPLVKLVHYLQPGGQEGFERTFSLRPSQ
jgi:RimJ/RimL family protein N-acetyltransferase